MSERAGEIWAHAFVGGGIAASSLALRLARDGAGPILVIEPTPDDPRTFAFWADRDVGVEDLVAHAWSTLRLAGPDGAFDTPLGRYRYRMIRANDLHAAARRAIEAGGGRVVVGRVDAVEDGADHATLVVGDDRYAARWVYDSRVPEGWKPEMVQSFVGHWVETDADTFDPAVATLMDFRVPQEPGAARFLHVLPTSARRALITGVTFAGDAGTFDVDVAGARVVAHEGGATPMTDHRFPRRTGARVMTIGNAGGRLKPSTGYAFVRIQDDAEAIAASLRRFGHPFDLPEPGDGWRWLDAALIRLVLRRGPAAVPIFVTMFRDNPMDRVLRFLDERASLADLARLVATLPSRGAFVAATAEVAARRFGAAWRFWAFAAWVLGAPSLAFLAVAPTDVEAAGPAMLVFLFAPAVGAWGLSRGIPRWPSERVWPAVGLAGVVTAAIVSVAVAASFLGGGLTHVGTFDPAGAAAAAASGVLTSTLEELGWAAGGIALARASLGPRAGVWSLGLVWAAWHLVIAAFAPAVVVSGMFGTADPFDPARIAGFVAGCVGYRVVLTALRDRAGAVWPAVAAHVTGNVLTGALLGSGWARFTPGASWVFFPGPTGLPFLAASLVAAAWLARRR